MTIRVAINGFGRIGRMVYRRAAGIPDIKVVAVNGTADKETLLHLLRYDSLHGTWKTALQSEPEGWRMGETLTRTFATRDPSVLPWRDLDIDVVVEATGKFRTRDTAGVHLAQGAKRVLITAPAKTPADVDITLVKGVNDREFNPALHRIISGASCTTNALAPVVKLLHEKFGLAHGLMTTVHSYTNDQQILDNPHADWRRARACGQSIIPTTTGAARAVGLVLPELAGKLNGVSLRVPTPNVSLVDLVATLERQTSVAEVNEALAEAAVMSMAGILGYTDEPLVSMDFNGEERSAVVDGTSTMMVGDRTVKVLAWYDNEWGYSCRIVDLVRLMGSTPLYAEDEQTALARF
ncbi:type I glyceraldehyde-3-phosphate dehydrogenase [Alicyclobacillaceae bacterium I2511]|nr:type I glyceraldehyde-3-phosphate dehydrogenase [Alicyclobacillaceae bacterium I2511]